MKAGGNGTVDYATTASAAVQSARMATTSSSAVKGGAVSGMNGEVPVSPAPADKRGAADAPARAAGEARLHEVWEGDERFFFGGKCITGPDWKMMVFTLGMVVVPSVVFVALVASDFGQVSYALVPLTLLLAGFSAAALVRTSCMDPGVIPRRPGRLPATLQPGMSRVYEVYLNGGRAVQVRYNDTGRLYQPPRAHHCSINDNCYDKFDHHCPWTGTTIAVRNYRPFLTFVLSTLGLVVWTVAICAVHLARSSREVREDGDPSTGSGEAVSRSGAALALVIFCLPASMFLVPLSAFHCYLVSKNRTTYENFKYGRQGHPFDLGSCLRNWWSVWCTPTPPPRVDFSGPASQLDRLTWWAPGDPWEQKGQVLEPDTDSEEEAPGTPGPGQGAPGGDVEQGGGGAAGGQGAAGAAGAAGAPPASGHGGGIRGLFQRSRPGTPSRSPAASRPGTPPPPLHSMSDASAPVSGDRVGVELARSHPRRTDASAVAQSEPGDPGAPPESRTPSNLGDSLLESAQEVLRKSVGLLGWNSATDVAAAAPATPPAQASATGGQGRRTPTRPAEPSAGASRYPGRANSHVTVKPA